MQIKVESVSEVQVKNKLPRMTINYTRDGKAQTRNLVGIGETKDVINVLKSAKSGDLFEVDLKKDGEYWNWVGARASTGTTSTGSGLRGKSTQGESRFETAEERHARQHYIVRQSSISSALEYYKLVEQKPPVEEVLGLAALFEKFVFGEMSDTEVEDVFQQDVEEDDEDVT